MNKIIILSILFLLIIPLALAAPSIENIVFDPSDDVWLDEDVTISLVCSSENKTIEQVYADIVGPDITLPRLYFTGSGNYSLFIDREYLDRSGQFDATIVCRDNTSDVNTTVKSFTISEFTGYINNISPDPSYTGDTIEIDFILEKSGVRITSDVIFNVSLNDELKELKIAPAYDASRGWILKLDSPSTGTYEVKVTAFYDRKNITDYDSIEIRNTIEFSIEYLDVTWIETNDNVTVRLRAMERGSMIELNENNVEIRINSVGTEITTISQNGDLFDVKIIAPSLSPGKYNIEAYLDHKGSLYSDSEPIDYVVLIEGQIVDEDNVVINAQIEFLQNDVTKLNVITDSYGRYSGYLPPDTYDIEIRFPKSTIYLNGVSVTGFDDPVKYSYQDNFDVPGIRNAGLYNYEIDLTYSEVDIEMKYNENNVINENELRVFRCPRWNSGRKICNEDWLEVGGEIDTVRNKVRLLSSTLSAFIIGEVKTLDVDFSIDNNRYYLGDTIRIMGLVKDNDGASVGNTSIHAFIQNSDINSDIVADENGIFSTELPVPRNEGKYVIVVRGKNLPYVEFRGEEEFEVSKSRSVFIDFPETIRIERGNNFTQEFSLLNSGQADIESIRISLQDIPEDYYNIVSNDIDLNSDERKTLYIDFLIPIYAETGISSATLKIESRNLSEEVVFGLNILEEGENKTVAAPTGLVTAFPFPEINYMDLVYIAIFAIACFSIAIVLKKRKVKKKGRGDVKGFLFDVGKYIKNENQNKFQGGKGSYDKLIATEFPNFLKFSKKLTKMKDDGDE